MLKCWYQENYVRHVYHSSSQNMKMRIGTDQWAGHATIVIKEDWVFGAEIEENCWLSIQPSMHWSLYPTMGRGCTQEQWLCYCTICTTMLLHHLHLQLQLPLLNFMHHTPKLGTIKSFQKNGRLEMIPKMIALGYYLRVRKAKGCCSGQGGISVCGSANMFKKLPNLLNFVF